MRQLVEILFILGISFTVTSFFWWLSGGITKENGIIFRNFYGNITFSSRNQVDEDG